MNISAITSKAGCEKTKDAIDTFLAAYMQPAFGSLPKAEVDLLVLRLLGQIGAVSTRPSIYELVSSLKVTRSKARKLIYDQELRTRSIQELDDDVRRILREPILQKRGESFALEIENPLLLDHIRAKLQKMGHLTDGSFSPSLVTLNVDAMVALVEAQLSEAQKADTLGALVAAGAPDKTFKGVLKAALKKLGDKIADESGQAVAEEVVSYIGPLIDARKSKITSLFKVIFSPSTN